MERSRFAVMVGAFVGTTIIAVVGLVGVGAASWLFWAYATALSAILTVGFWPRIGKWRQGRLKRRTEQRRHTEIGEPITVESEYQVLDPENYLFPSNLEPVTDQRSGAPDETFGVYLKVLNPGKTDTWDARIETVEGAEWDPVARWYVRWRGQHNEARTVHHGDTALLELGVWKPMGEGWRKPGEVWRPSQLTLSSSTGHTDLFMSREGLTGTPDLATRRITLVIRLLSHETDRQTKYRIRVGATSLSDLSPDVIVEPLNRVENTE